MSPGRSPLQLAVAQPLITAHDVSANVVTVDGWRLGLAICKDTGVREHAAATAATGFEMCSRRAPGASPPTITPGSRFPAMQAAPGVP